jgi:hypothetical protein
MADSVKDTTAGTAIVLNRDIMFGSQIRNALNALGLRTKIVGSTERFVTALEEAGQASSIGIVDMNGVVDWTVLGGALRRNENWPPILAFGPHVDVEGRRAAKAAGVTRVVSNGQFHRDMTLLIDRYRRH